MKPQIKPVAGQVVAISRHFSGGHDLPANHFPPFIRDVDGPMLGHKRGDSL